MRSQEMEKAKKVRHNTKTKQSITRLLVLDLIVVSEFAD